jgi:hypothetical protein
MLTFIFGFNKTSQSFTLASNLLVIVTKLLNCEIDILILVIGLSIGVPVNVIVGPNDGLKSHQT